MKTLLVLGLGLAVMAAEPGPPRSHPQTHTIEISSMAFHPERLQVEPGDTIIWINRDIVPHTSTSLRKPGWDTGQLLQGQRGVWIPRRAGNSEYRCELHPTMVGRLVVR